MSFDSLSQTPPADLEVWQAEFRGLRLGVGTSMDWRTRAGFMDMPDLRTDDTARPWDHGVWSGDDYANARILSWTVLLRATGQDLLDMVRTYRKAMAPLPAGAPLLPLWSYEPDIGLVRWDVKPRRHSVPEDGGMFVSGMIEALAQLDAPDPVGYGPGQVASTGFAVERGGLQFDLFTDGTATTGSLEFGALSSSGRNRVSNAGNAPLLVAHRVTGPTPTAGFEIVDTSTGRRLRYEGVVPAGSVLDIDTATGDVILDGTADRSRLLTVSEFGAVPAGASTEFAFLPLSSATAAQLQTAYASAWW